MIEPETKVALPAAGSVIPKSVELFFVRVKPAQRIGPPLVENAPP